MPSNKFRRRAFLAVGTALAAFGAFGPSAAPFARAGQRGTSQPDAPVIDGDFAGGNIVLERIEGDHVYLHQDQRDTPGFWFYWCFRVRGAAGRTLTFHFTGGNVLGVRGPAVSTDGGKAWDWLGAESMQGASFTYKSPDGADEARFCLAVPYQEANLREFLDRHKDDPHLKVEHHSTTKKGRKTERLRLGKLDGEPEHRVLLTARHHCCEMMAGWALEGLMDAVLADAPDGRWLREHVEFLVIPFMDKDGVEDGDQGKNRKPHDHNRDYLGESIYPSVAALKEFAPQWSQGQLRLAIDVHCPSIRGGGDGPSSNERVFFVGNPSPETWERQQQFCRVLQQVQTGPLVYDPKHNLPWGQQWNTLKEPKSCSRWTASLPGVLIGTTIEIPYANVAGTPVTAETARALGRDLARAIRGYLERNPR
ncbi:MAG TPA: M14 family zinc carboxypeptidase [Thermoguttaceae bacterium]|nr:M14 family zinc carboxypeptidase [Thermoguttaceae bacterium]